MSLSLANGVSATYGSLQLRKKGRGLKQGVMSLGVSGEESVLLSFFMNEEDGREALRQLRRKRFRRVALLHKSFEGTVRIEGLSRRSWIWLGVGSGLLLGILGVLLALVLSGFANVLLSAISLVFSTLFGGIAGWLIVRYFGPGVDGDVLEKNSRWLVAEETLVILQAPSKSMSRAIPILRQAGEIQPSIFTLYPEQEEFPGEVPLHSAPLSAAQLHPHALRLATGHQIEAKPTREEPLLRRLDQAGKVIDSICQTLLESNNLEQSLSPSAEWLLDNGYIVQGHLRHVRLNLTKKFYHELPVLVKDSRRGEPRVYSLAVELIQHTDGRVDRQNISEFLGAYQSVSGLRIGELWAMPLILRIGLIDRLHWLALQVDKRFREREVADFWANRLLATARRDSAQLFFILAELAREQPEPSEYFASQLTGHLYDEQAALVPALSWLERSLHDELSNVNLKEQGRQAALQVSIGNAITSLRELSLLDWRDIFEGLSAVESTLSKDPAGVYRNMDFNTRDRYRQTVEEISRGATVSEMSVANAAVELAFKQASDRSEDPRLHHVGYYLVDKGRKKLVKQLGGREQRRYQMLQWVYRHYTALYLMAIGLITAMLVSVPLILGILTGVGLTSVIILALLALLPASQVAVQLVNYVVTRLLPPRTLPKMSFEKQGIPDEFRTLVVVPMLMMDEQTICEELSKLEIRYLANPQSNLLFGLFADLDDATEQHLESDADLLKLTVKHIEELNERYGANRFYLFYREREWCESENRFIGWERKRGKLEDLNRLLCGEPARKDHNIVHASDPDQLVNVRFVITLDSDTQLPKDSARRMIETLAHPLNQPHIGLDGNLLEGGYTIIQPRVSTSLPSATASPFSRLFTDPVGTDPYTRAVSDVYQDLSGEGAYHGKGIYDPRVFYRALSGRFPDQKLLSHDLIEGVHVRVGLASDIELFDEFPEDYLAYTNRQHRWIRGDWQIIDWLLPRVPTLHGERVPNPLTVLNRWKIFDNLRRSLVQASLVLFLVVSWFLSPSLGLLASSLSGLMVLFQTLIPPLTWATTPAGSAKLSMSEIGRQFVRSIAETALIPHQARVSLDAIIRVWYRRLISRRGFLEWTTSQMTGSRAASHARLFLSRMRLVSLFSLAVGILVWRFQLASLYAALPFLILWFVSPLIAWGLNVVPSRRSKKRQVSYAHLKMLRQMVRKTWRFFDDFVGPESNWLPPDNFQVFHQNTLALRTSPTNIGLWALSVLGARDFGFLTGDQVIERLGSTFKTLSKLERFEGHLLNWYDIRDLSPLEPRYVSMVDSGNLLSCLWALEQGMRELMDEPLIGPRVFQGLEDTLEVLRSTLDRNDSHLQDIDKLARLFNDIPGSLDEILKRVRQAVEPAAQLTQELRESVGSNGEPVYWAGQIERQILDWITIIDRYLQWTELLASEPVETLVPLGEQVITARRQLLAGGPSLRALATGRVPSVQAILESRAQTNGSPQSLVDFVDKFGQAFSKAKWLAGEVLAQGEQIIRDSRELADGINMRFLYDADRRLFSIGYNVSNQRLDGSHYDLLASEARLGGFVAIARGDVPSEHWLAMNRPFGSVDGRNVLLSWTGTMFEYLMPLLLQRTFDNSLLDMAAREAVAVQRKYGRQRGVPWGMSESAYGDLDANKTYQYRAFGVPGLGLKRGLEEDLVVAPYATLLALPIDPAASVKNLRRLVQQGLYGKYGFFEAIDFRRQRRREGKPGVVVQAYMAHHQAMGFLAINNFIFDQAMQKRFHSDPRVKAVESLLYERIPLSPPLYYISAREQPPLRAAAKEISLEVNKFETPHTLTPRTQLLSNGRYSLMVTAAGGGYSQWDNFEITRWRADTTRDHWGTFCYIRDVDTDQVWSNTYQPTGSEPDDYTVIFAMDRAEINRRDHGIETKTNIVVSPEDDTEIRQIALINQSLRTRRLEITSYLELALAPHNADRQHPAFNKLFVQTEAISHLGSLLASRRPRDQGEPPIYVAHRFTFEDGSNKALLFETDRRRFIGRGRTITNPTALRHELTNTDGYVLDPMFSLRRMVTLRPGQRLTFSLILSAAESRQDVLGLMEKYSDPNAIARALELAWAHAQIEMRLLRIQPDDTRRFQRLGCHMLYPNSKLRPTHERLEQNRLGQSRLWSHGISGDLPIATVSISEARDISLVRQMLQAHMYWRLHGLKTDLLILNEESSSYEQPLHEQLTRLVESHSMYTGIDQAGGVFLRSADQIPEEELTLMLAASRVALVAARGPLSQQLGTPSEITELPDKLRVKRIHEEPSAPLPFMELPYFNSLGGFTPDGREYAIYLGPDAHAPAPWVNVIANPSFGTLVSESGSGYTWYGNSQQNRLVGWSNDPVCDPPGEAIYIRDEESGMFWTPTPQPVRELDAYRARHGAGYSVFEHNSHAIEQELVTFVPMDESGGEPIRIQRLRLRNDSTRTRQLSVTSYVEWTLGGDREDTQIHVVTKWDSEIRAMLARNRYHSDYGERIAFAALSPSTEDYSGDRTAFIGRNRSLSNPAAMQRVSLSGHAGAGHDPCSAMQVKLELDPGEEAEVILLLGQAGSLEEVHQLVRKYRESLMVDEKLQQTKQWWDRLLGSIEVKTPELSVDYLLNRWLLYQTLSCRIWGRSAFYQSGGAYGFRDQLQDVMALVHAAPDLAREHILLAASRQFKEGDVQHWWHPPSGAGIRSRISDDLLWLPYVVSHYVRVAGEVEILAERVPFLAAQPLEKDEHEVYLVPEETSDRETLYEHCRRAIERGLTSGPHGLPLIGIGDWNDGMNRVGVGGSGESVWLAWFLVDVLNRFAELSDLFGQSDQSEQYLQRARQLTETVEREAWDGDWYRRATFDDGTPLGSASNEEARIDSLPQSWAWLSGAADVQRATRALESAWKHLVREDEKLVLLFTPPFDKTPLNPGYIKGYPPGVRENGGQYTHAALWLAMALARSGDGEKAVKMLRILNPVEHAREPEDVQRYFVEPYVVAADVYRLPRRVGQGGWTWYTGSAGWMYRAWIEEVLGLKVQSGRLVIDPVIQPDWEGFNIRYRHGEAIYEINVENPERVTGGVAWIEMDGRRLEGNAIPLEKRAIKHKVLVHLGDGVTSKETPTT